MITDFAWVLSLSTSFRIKQEKRAKVIFRIKPYLTFLVPSEPQNLQLCVQGPSGNARPRMTVRWRKPAKENGIITKYTLVYTYILEGKVTTRGYISNSSKILSYSFDVLGGIQYTVNLWAETIKPGPNATNASLVPVYGR